jgi:[protein-PII] uridylyltransferase
MGRRYRRLKDKTLLHLALLIHDIGKGFEEDHCIVGARIAADVAKNLELDSASAEFLEWLIAQHLLVNTIAFRYNLDDPEIIESFAKEVGSIRRLELLVVHAVADLTAVGPGVINDWKLNLIEELYRRARRYFEKGQLPGDNDEKNNEIRQQIREMLTQQDAKPVSFEILDQFPGTLLRQGSVSQIAARLVDIGNGFAQGRRSLCSAEYDEKVSTMCYRVVCRAEEQIGTFARVTGALATCGLAILRADVETIGENLVWDCFWVNDPDYTGAVPDFRVQEVCQRIVKLIDSPDEPLPPYRRTWRTEAKDESPSVHVLPTNVVFDNVTVDRYTILSVFAYDQIGLLHRIAVAIAELRLVLHFAKIDTHLDQIADVFYVTEDDGSQIDEGERQDFIRDRLVELVDGDESE